MNYMAQVRPDVIATARVLSQRMPNARVRNIIVPQEGHPGSCMALSGGVNVSSRTFRGALTRVDGQQLGRKVVLQDVLERRQHSA